MSYGPLSILIAGLLATLAMTTWQSIANAFGAAKHHPGFFLGTWIFGVTRRAFIWGLVFHFLIGIVIAGIYAAILSALGSPAGAGPGLVLGALHWLVVMLSYGLVDRVHPGVRHGALEAPGLFARNEGWAEAATSGVSHLLYGGIVGLTLGAYRLGTGLAAPYSYDSWQSPEFSPSIAFVVTVLLTVATFIALVGIMTPLGEGDEIFLSAAEAPTIPREEREAELRREEALRRASEAEPGHEEVGEGGAEIPREGEVPPKRID